MQKFDLDFTWFPHKYDSRVANFNFIIEQKLEKTIYSKRGKEYAIYICTLPDGTGSNQTDFCPCSHFSSTLMASTRSLIWQRLSEYNFYYPVLDDKEFVDWLEGNNFQPRMLEYLSPGIFTCKEIIKMQAGKHIDLDCIDAKFKIGLLFVIDRIDIEFRKNILSWITGIENAYKTYFNRIRIADDGYDVGAEVISEWVAKKPKIAKLIKRARDKRRYRGSSDEFDYLTDENAVPLLDLMEQLELNELSELITIFYDVYSRKDSIPDILHKMKECIPVKSDSNSDDLSDDEESWWEKRHEEFEEIIAEQIKEAQEKARAQKELAWANYLNSQLVSQQRLQGFLIESVQSGQDRTNISAFQPMGVSAYEDTISTFSKIVIESQKL